MTDISDAEAKAEDSKEVRMATSNKIGEEYDNDEDGNVDCGGDGSSDSELLSDNKGSPDNETLSNSELLLGELLSDA